MLDLSPDELRIRKQWLAEQKQENSPIMGRIFGNVTPKKHAPRLVRIRKPSIKSTLTNHAS